LLVDLLVEQLTSAQLMRSGRTFTLSAYNEEEMRNKKLAAKPKERAGVRA
jgi:hypothetical protein